MKFRENAKVNLKVTVVSVPEKTKSAQKVWSQACDQKITFIMNGSD
jgi:hypothetical protein